MRFKEDYGDEDLEEKDVAEEEIEDDTKEEKELNYVNKRIILWIDPNDNAVDLKKLKDAFPGDLIKKVKSIEEGMEILGNVKYEFRLIHVITSGAISQDFMDEYEKNLQSVNVITANIIYCGNQKRHEKKVFFQDPFFNPGMIVVKLSEVINYIKQFDVHWYEKIKPQEKYKSKAGEKFGNTFNTSNVVDLANLAYPTMISQVITEDSVCEEGIIKFFNKIRTYPEEMNGCPINREAMLAYTRPQRNLEIKFPFYFYSKFFLRLYSMDSPFFKELNRDLTNGKRAEYDQFINCLFLGLKEHYLHSVKNETLYRGSDMSIEEFQEIKQCFEESQEKSSALLGAGLIKVNMAAQNKDFDYLIGKTDVALTTCTANCFLSFGRNEKIVDKDFIARKFKNYCPEDGSTPKNKGLMIVKFIIDPIPKDAPPYFVSNIDVGDLSARKKEKEVLILPGSCFKVASIDEVSQADFIKQVKNYQQQKRNGVKNPKPIKVTTIHLQHLYQYAKQINDYVTWQSKEEIKKFFEMAGGNMSQSVIAKASEEGKNTIVWIDQFAKCLRYTQWIQTYQEYLANFNIHRANTVENGFRILRNYSNRLVYVIVSGYLFPEFKKQLKKSANELSLRAVTIVLCENEELFDQYSQLESIGDPFYNPGNIFNTFKEVLEYIFKNETNVFAYKKANTPATSEDYGSTFKSVGDPRGVIAKVFADFINDKNNFQPSLLQFGKFIAAVFKDDELTGLAYPGYEKNVIFPTSVYSTNFLKMYMLRNSGFFQTMCMDLTNGENFEYYAPYIYIMYSAIRDGSFESYTDGHLFRGCLLNRQELAGLKALAGEEKYIYLKPFLSFTADRQIAFKYLAAYKERETESLALCEIVIRKPDDEYKKYVFNIMTGKYSQFSQYQEILTLPYTCFTVADVQEKEGYYTIILDYVLAGINGFQSYGEINDMI